MYWWSVQLLWTYITLWLKRKLILRRWRDEISATANESPFSPHAGITLYFTNRYKTYSRLLLSALRLIQTSFGQYLFKTHTAIADETNGLPLSPPPGPCNRTSLAAALPWDFAWGVYSARRENTQTLVIESPIFKIIAFNHSDAHSSSCNFRTQSRTYSLKTKLHV